MKKLWIVGIALLLLAILVQFPAAWLAPAVGRATSERWRLAATEGTVWAGRGSLYSFDRASGSWSAGRSLRWRVSWASLAQGALAARLAFDDGGQAELEAGARGWTLRGLDATFPAAQLAVLLPSTVGDYGWAGTLAARSSGFRCTWNRPRCTGQFDLAWDDASTAQIPGPPLGDYRVRLTAEGEALRFAVTTVRGRLQLAGGGEVSQGRLAFSGEAQAAGDDVRLESLLRAIARPGPAPGRYLIEYRETQAAR